MGNALQKHLQPSSATLDEKLLIGSNSFFLRKGGDVTTRPSFQQNLSEKVEIGVSPGAVDIP